LTADRSESGAFEGWMLESDPSMVEDGSESAAS
jgi:hypothetical protein